MIWIALSLIPLRISISYLRVFATSCNHLPRSPPSSSPRKKSLTTRSIPAFSLSWNPSRALKKNTIHKPAAADEVRHARKNQLCLKLSLLLLDDCPFRPKVRTRAFSLRALQLLRVGYGVEVTSLVNFRKGAYGSRGCALRPWSAPLLTDVCELRFSGNGREECAETKIPILDGGK